MKRKQIQRKNNCSGSRRGFIPLEQFQMQQAGQMPSTFRGDAIKVGAETPAPKPVPRLSPKPHPTRATFFTLRHGHTRVTNPFLRQMIKEKETTIATAKVIQGLLDLGLIEPGRMKDFLLLDFYQLKSRAEHLLSQP